MSPVNKAILYVYKNKSRSKWNTGKYHTTKIMTKVSELSRNTDRRVTILNDCHIT